MKKSENSRKRRKRQGVYWYVCNLTTDDCWFTDKRHTTPESAFKEAVSEINDIGKDGQIRCTPLGEPVLLKLENIVRAPVQRLTRIK